MNYVPGRGESEKERRNAFKELSVYKKEIEKADVILYARQYGVFSKKGWQEFKKFFNKPVIIATEAIINQLRKIGASKIFVLTPYNQYRHDYEIKWLRGFNFKVIGSIALGRTGGKMIATTLHELVIEATRIAQENPEAEAIYIACTILSTIPILHELQGKKPVITASSALLEEMKEVVRQGVGRKTL